MDFDDFRSSKDIKHSKIRIVVKYYSVINDSNEDKNLNVISVQNLHYGGI